MKKPIPTFRRKIGKLLLTVTSIPVSICYGMIMRVRRVDVDYSHWLGPYYKNLKPTNFSRSSCIVSNHSGGVDAII